MNDTVLRPPPGRSETVLQALRDAVLRGEFAPGDRLGEIPLTERLGVSRTPVRAALQRLASEGLLDHAPNRGFRVRAFPIDEIVGAYDVRAVLEGLAARVAAERGVSAEHRAILDRAIAVGDRLLVGSSLTDAVRSRYGAVNKSLHETIHAAGGSRLFGEMIHLCRQVLVSSPHHVVAFQLHDVRRRHEEHHQILEAIAARDPGRAETLMRDHVASVKSSLMRSIKGERSSGADPEDEER